MVLVLWRRDGFKSFIAKYPAVTIKRHCNKKRFDLAVFIVLLELDLCEWILPSAIFEKPVEHCFKIFKYTDV